MGDPEDQLGERRGHPFGDRAQQLGVAEVGDLASARQNQSRVGAVATHQTGGQLEGGQLGARCGAEEGEGCGPAGAGRQPGCCGGRVDGVLRHPAVRRELAADDGDDAGAAGEHGVTPREVGRRVLARTGGGVEQGPQTGEGADHVVAVQRTGEGGRDDVEQEADLALRGRGHVGHRALDRLVGEADVERAVGLGQHHHEAARRPRYRREDRGGEAGQGLGPQHQVGAAAGPEPHLVDQVAGPDPGRVDHRSGGHGVRGAAQLVAQVDAGPGGAEHPRTGAHVCAVRGSRARDGGDQPGVVLELTVPRQRAAGEAGGPQRRRHGEELGRREPTRRRQGVRRRAGAAAQQVAGAHPRPGQQLLGSTGRRRERHDVRHRAGEVGSGDLHQDAALDGALVGDADLAVGEVAQAAVHQLGGPA